MPLQAPKLDDRRYADLVAELRARIPRHAPEWTDHNDSDPGMTLIQLFSWLGEIILYRLNRVPELNYIKFLQLIGVERKPAVPARAELTFSLVENGPAIVFIAQGTQVAAESKPPPPSAGTPPLPAEEEEPLVFETDEPLYALGALLSTVQVFDGTAFREFTVENQPGGRSYPAFGQRAREGSTLMLGFASVQAFPVAELNLTVRVPSEGAITEVSCDFPEERIQPSATVAWEFWDGREWRRLSVIRDETRALTRSGHVYFRGPKEIKKARLGLFTSAADPELYWLRCLLVRSQYEQPPQVEAILTNTVRATAVTTVRDEVMGASNGQPAQKFLLRHSPVNAAPTRSVDDRLREQAARTQPPTESEQLDLDARLRERETLRGFLLEVDEGLGAKPWEEVEDFFNSGEGDKHYTLNRATGEMGFGNGEHGAIPLAGINNIVCRLYRSGGGKRGNAGAGTITGLLSSAPGLEAVTNHYAAEDGSDEEDLEDTKQRAPKELKARDRAITAEDFEFLARQTPGARIRRAHALPLRHPQFPDVEVPGTVTVIVVPESDDPRPMPSEGTLRTVAAWLNLHRLLTTEVFVAAPNYQQVRIEAVVVAAPNADPARLKTAIEVALLRYLHPLTGGEDGLGWPLGGTVYYSQIFRVILQIEGVQRVEDARLIVDGRRYGRCEDALIPSGSLIFSEAHEANVIFTPSSP